MTLSYTNGVATRQASRSVRASVLALRQAGAFVRRLRFASGDRGAAPPLNSRQVTTFTIVEVMTDPRTSRRSPSSKFLRLRKAQLKARIWPGATRPTGTGSP
jgi:hypothetical protein